MASKSIKLYWNEKLTNIGGVLAVLFGERKETVDARFIFMGAQKKGMTSAQISSVSGTAPRNERIPRCARSFSRRT